MSLDHEARRHRVGASEVAAILGLNEYQTPLDVWLVKTGRKPPFEGNEHTKRGQRQEAHILQWLAEDLGMMVDSSMGGFELHPHGIAAATPDALVYPFGVYSHADLERLKMHSSNNYLTFGQSIEDCYPNPIPIELAETKSTLKTIRDESEIPLSWLLQCQWQMECTGLKKCHLAIFGPMVSNYQRFEIAYNEAFAKELLAQVEEWWQVHIVGDKQPEPINESDILTLFPQDDGTTIEAVDVLYEAINQYASLKAQIKDLSAACESLRERIVIAFGPAQNVRYGGRWIASYKTDKRGIRSLRT